MGILYWWSYQYSLIEHSRYTEINCMQLNEIVYYASIETSEYCNTVDQCYIKNTLTHSFNKMFIAITFMLEHNTSTLGTWKA